MAADRPGVVEISWMANPFRAEKFEAIWLPAAEAVMRYGARHWSLLRSRDEPSQFIQLAFFDSLLDFERYWYSEEIAEARTNAGGLFQLPVAPHWHDEIGSGTLRATSEEAAAAG